MTSLSLGLPKSPVWFLSDWAVDQTNAVWDRDQPGNPEDEWKNDEKKEYFANTIVFSDIEPKLLMNTSQLTSVGLPKKKNSLIIPMYLSP